MHHTNSSSSWGKFILGGGGRETRSTNKLMNKGVLYLSVCTKIAKKKTPNGDSLIQLQLVSIVKESETFQYYFKICRSCWGKNCFKENSPSCGESQP